MLIQSAIACQMASLIIEFFLQPLSRWSPWFYFTLPCARIVIAALAFVGAMFMVRGDAMAARRRRAWLALTVSLGAVTVWHTLMTGLALVRSLGYSITFSLSVRDWLTMVPGALWFIVLLCVIPTALEVNRHLGTRRFSDRAVFLVIASSLAVWLLLRFYDQFRPDLGAQAFGMAAWKAKLAIHGAWSISCLVFLDMARRRLPHGPRCSRCRYDLTGNASGVCPECGAAIEAGA